MSRIALLKPDFVEFMPPVLEAGTIYVSIPYLLTAHLCACGCGEKVVLPLHPSQWRITYDGLNVSLYPSVGNTGLACRSHYWIKNGRIEWSMEISAEQARRGHERDRRALANHGAPSVTTQTVDDQAQTRNRSGLWHRLFRRR